MKTIIKMEEAAMTAISIFLLTRYNLGLSAWVWVLLFFSPDISMLGYLAGSRVGALFYNLIHHRGIALLVVAIGLYLANEVLIATGILLFGHSSFDRMMGYGLKYDDNFKHTHLGWIGKDTVSNPL
jgi:hypothetical protein